MPCGSLGAILDVAVRQVTIEVPQGTSLKERQKQLDLKRHLLRKRLKPVLALFFKAFQPGYESVAFLYIEGALARLQTHKSSFKLKAFVICISS